MVLYLIKINIALGLLYLLYRLLFRNDTFLRLRRITLMAILAFAFLYPFPDLKDWISDHAVLMQWTDSLREIFHPAETMASNGLTGGEIIGAGKVENNAVAFPRSDWFTWISIAVWGVYALGVIVLSCRCLAEIVSVCRLRRRSSRREINGIPACSTPEAEIPYSFFRWIFICPEEYNPQSLSEILIHETAHVRQLHSVDVVFAQLVTIICWINPFAWLLKKEITINHEFIADREVMRAGFNKKEYQYHLIGVERNHLAAANIYNYFSVLPLKKRITMLNKKRMHRARVIKYLALLPAAAALLLLNNIDAMARITPELTVPETVEIVEETALVNNVIAAPVPPEDDKVYTVVDIMPRYADGETALLKLYAKNLKYPEDAIKEKVEGRVVVSFIVEKDGSVTNPEVVRSIYPSLDAEAVRVVLLSSKQWTPGKQGGKNVRVKYTVPIQFKL